MPAMPAMAHRPDSATLLVPQASACPHSVCAPLPARMTERNPVLAHPAPSLEVVLQDEFLLVPGAEQSTAAVRGPPPIRSVSPVSLHILVRV